MATRRMGIDGKVYYASVDTWDAETYTAIDRVSDIEENVGWNTAPAGDRGQGVDTEAKTTAKLEYTGKCRVDDSDAGYLALRAAFLARDTPINLMILNGSKTSNGATGFRGYFHVTNFAMPQGMQEVDYVNFRFVAAPFTSTTPLKSVLVTTGAPVSTNVFAPPA
jgi:hypothetical protein